MSLPTAVISSQGDAVVLMSNFAIFSLELNKVKLLQGGLVVKEWVYASPALAAVDFGLWAAASGSVSLQSQASSLVWTSVTPSSISAGYPPSLSFVGSGFIQYTSTLLLMKLDDLNGDVAWLSGSAQSDTSYQTEDGTQVVANTGHTHHIYYSMDNGETFTDTGLTITVT